jgi:hypothetical protein
VCSKTLTSYDITLSIPSRCARFVTNDRRDASLCFILVGMDPFVFHGGFIQHLHTRVLYTTKGQCMLVNVVIPFSTPALLGSFIAAHGS